MTTTLILEQLRKAVAIGCALILTPTTALLLAQDQAPLPEQQDQQQQQQGPAPQQAPMLAPQQLDGLVAPIALYPDSLLSQVLVAATYPLEIVEANQWLQQNRNLQGQALIQAAQQQNWDPSIQALVAFPDVVGRLAQDVRWVTDLGNAFLAQQADVMSAVQRLRAQARSNGKLQSNQQETVTDQEQDGQQAIEIQPANPLVVYVPTYNPAYFWGDMYPYPSLYYPGIGVGWGFGYGVSLGLYFGGCCGWGGWGWGPNWFGRSVFVNGGFFHRYQFNDFHGGGFGRAAWTHDPGHRLGIAYPNRAVAAQYRGGANSSNRGYAGSSYSNRGGYAGSTYANRGGNYTPSAQRNFSGSQVNRGYTPQRAEGPSERVGSREVPQANYGSHSAFGPVQNGNTTRVQSDHGYSSMHNSGGGGGGGARSAPAAHSGGGGGGSHGGGGGGGRR